MPEYSVITGCRAPGMETQGRLLSVCGIHAGTGTDETTVDNVDQALPGRWKARQVRSSPARSSQQSRQKAFYPGRHRPTTRCVVAACPESALGASSPCTRDLEAINSGLRYVEPLTAVQAKAEDAAYWQSTASPRNGGQPDMSMVG